MAYCTNLMGQPNPVLKQAGQLAYAEYSAGLEVAAMELGVRGIISPYPVSHGNHPNRTAEFP